jgi:putative aldouronate transport system permease protein
MRVATNNPTLNLETKYRREMWRKIRKDKWYYLLLLPGIIYFLVFRYGPMWGILIAFKNYMPFLGFWKSPWVGFQNFEDFFANPDFFKLLRNTLLISFYNLIFTFPAPIILALLLNEVKNALFKRTVQTLVYIPHFISMTIVVSLTYIFLTTQGGFVNNWLYEHTGRKIQFLTDPKWFRPLIIIQTIWKETGWGTIIFLAALTNINPSLYEAAIVDGAKRWQQMRYITLPCLMPTVIILLILRLGGILDTGFEQIYLMMNSLNREVADVFDTYVYTMGITRGAFSYSTAVGLFKSIVGIVLIQLSNLLARKVSDISLF